MRTHRRIGLAIAVAFAVSAAPGVVPAEAERPKAAEIRVLSNRADLVSAGDAYVEIVLPKPGSPAGLRVQLGRRDVSDAFAVRENGRILGVVDGLRVGKNVLRATLPNGRGARITITNHPIGGPVFSGPQVQPWPCTTEENGLGAPQDQQCNAPPIHLWHYKNAVTGQFHDYDPESPPPEALIATTTTDEGETVPYIVRHERGTLNRAIYDLAVLFDPDQPWEPWAPQRGWNRKLGYSFGGGCSTSHGQGSAQDPLIDRMLSRGFAVGVSTLNVFGNGCNLHVSAETLMMVKERISETLGEIRYTIGQGGSGGAEAQHSIAENYPGLLDGIRPTATFADGWTPAIFDKGDCPLLMRYFNETSPHLWPLDSQRAAVTGGNPSSSICTEMAAMAEALPANTKLFDPTTGCGDDSAEWMYEPEGNPQGTRCTMQDYNVAALGRRGDGFANGLIDYVGLQWGLHALYAGEITPEQFVDLNEKIGGWDIDYRWQRERSEADREGLRNFYRTGQFTYGRNLAKVPSMDLRGDNTVDFHSNVHREIVRARLDRSWGSHESQVYWFDVAVPLAGAPSLDERTFEVVNEWLGAIEQDTSAAAIEAKVVRNKPAAAVDGCFLAGQPVDNETVCEAAYTENVLPRMAAGMPITGDVLKCRLKPLYRADYRIHGIRFTDSQWTRLLETFPTGVCDWSKPGVGQQRPREPWLTLANGPGGTPLGPPPQSIPIG